MEEKPMNILFSFLLLFTPLQTTINTQTTTKEEVILIYGDELSMLFLISIQPSHTVSIKTIPMNTMIPAVCANNHPTALSNISDEDCIKASLAAVYPLEITNSLYLHTKQIEQDFTVSLPARACKNFADMQTYFHEIGTQISYSIIWGIHDYINSDISLLDLYTYYDLYTADDLKLQYYFLHLIQLDAFHSVSLDTQFYKLKG